MKIELNEKQLKSLYKAFTVLESEEEVRRFLFDLCTKNELAAMAQRLRVAEMLTKKRAYNEIEEETAASSATISRVSGFLTKKGAEGYKLVLVRMDKDVQ